MKRLTCARKRIQIINESSSCAKATEDRSKSLPSEALAQEGLTKSFQGEILNVVLWCSVALSHNLNAEDLSSQLHGYFMANYDQFGGNYQVANERYKDILDSGAPLYAYKGYVHLLYDTGNFDKILYAIPQLDPVFAKDAEIELIFAQVMDRSGRKNEADDRFIKLNDTFKSNQEIAFNASNSYLRRKEPENALKVIDGLLNSSPRKPNNFIFYFMKSQIHLQLNDKVKALDSIQKSLDLHPRFDKGWLLYALLNEQSGQLKDAIKGYSSFLEVSPGSNRDIESHLLQLIFKQKTLEQSHNNILVMNKQCFERAILLFDKKQYDQALEQIDQCIKEKPDDDQAKLLRIQILSSMMKPEKAADFIKDLITKNPDKDMWYKTLHLLTKTNLNPDYAIKILKEIEQLTPHQLLPILYLADLLTRTHKAETALQYHKKALTITTDTKIKEKVLYQMAITYYQAKDFKAFNQIISQVEQLKTSFAPLLNLIAYYYVSIDKNDVKAQELMNTVLKHDRNNPHFLDTQALIYITQKKYDNALEILEKIAQKLPSDYTILMHLAQARHGKGEKQQALLTMRQAKRCATTECDKKECETLVDQWQQTKKI